MKNDQKINQEILTCPACELATMHKDIARNSLAVISVTGAVPGRRLRDSFGVINTYKDMPKHSRLWYEWREAKYEMGAMVICLMIITGLAIAIGFSI